MAKIYKSAKGKVVDMEGLRATHGKTVAAGNAGLNAQGDTLGAGGQVVKKVAEKARAYNSTNPKAVRKVSVKDDIGAEHVEDSVEEFQDSVDKPKVEKTKTKTRKTKAIEQDDGSFEIVSKDDSGE